MSDPDLDPPTLLGFSGGEGFRLAISGLALPRGLSNREDGWLSPLLVLGLTLSAVV